jgi:uncharacterized protein YqeY
MPTPRERLESDLRAAMKAGEKERLSTVRLLLTEVNTEALRRGLELDEAAFVAVLRRAIKQRHEAAGQFRTGGRDELAAKEEREAEILGGYLPAAPGEAEIRAAVEAFVAERGLQGGAAIGPVMKEMLARFGPAVDGATVNRVVREALAARG